jgi:hypothetical protein
MKGILKSNKVFIAAFLRETFRQIAVLFCSYVRCYFLDVGALPDNTI